MEQKTGHNARKTFLSHAEAGVSTERTLFDTVGDELKRTRVSVGLDIQTVSERLKIKSSYLTALENNDYVAFPAVVYGIAFLRTYAQFLGLEADPLIERFKSETNHLVSNDSLMPIIVKHNVLPKKRTLWICGISLACLWGIWYVLTRPQDVSVVVVPNETIMTPVIEPVVTAPIESDLILNQSVEEITGELNTVVPFEKLNPSENLSDERDEKTSDLPDTMPIFETLTGKKYGVEQGAVIVLIATDRVWVDVKDKDTIIFNQILSKGDAYFVPADKNGLIMRTGNARGLEIYVNGVSKGQLSHTETVKNNILLKPETFEKH